MSISNPAGLCERLSMKPSRQAGTMWLVTFLIVAGFSASAQSNVIVSNIGVWPVTVAPAQTSPSPTQVESTTSAASPPSSAAASTPWSDESAFNIIGERNIFNANRSGGRVRLPTSRPTRIESFTLVGTMAYEKGVFAFFEGSSSEFTKAVKAEGVIAGHKLADIFAGSVKLEADGKQVDLPVGSQMRREDAGAWLVVAEAGTRDSSSGSSNGDAASRSSRGGDYSSRSRRNGDSSSRRSTTPEPAGITPAAAAPSTAEQSEILKRLMERREKE